MACGPRAPGRNIDDLAAVLEHTGARNVFGHSGGGFVALRAALSLPLDRVAVYELGVAISGCLPTAFIDPFEEAVRAGDYPLALAVLGPSIGTAGPAAKLPLGVQLLISRAFLRTPDRTQIRGAATHGAARNPPDTRPRRTGHGLRRLASVTHTAVSGDSVTSHRPTSR